MAFLSRKCYSCHVSGMLAGLWDDVCSFAPVSISKGENYRVTEQGLGDLTSQRQTKTLSEFQEKCELWLRIVSAKLLFVHGDKKNRFFKKIK